MKIYIKFFLLIFLLSPKIFADESLLKNYNKLKNLLNNETITIEQFNSGIDNIMTSPVENGLYEVYRVPIPVANNEIDGAFFLKKT